MPNGSKRDAENGGVLVWFVEVLWNPIVVVCVAECFRTKSDSKKGKPPRIPGISCPVAIMNGNVVGNQPEL
jgi:hypothetical protein